MGVIDLNARVAALEQNGAGGEELDQLEAAVTAIENGLTVTTTDVTEDCTFGDLSEGYVVIQTYGKIATAVLFAENSTAASITQSIYSIPDELMFSTYTFIGDPVAVRVLGSEISLTVAAGNTVSTMLLWIIDPPAPEPGE